MDTIPTRQQVPNIVSAQPGGVRRPMPSPAQGQVAGLSGKDVIRILRKRVWLIVIFFVVFVILSLVGTFIWLRTKPFFSAVAYIQVSPQRQQMLDISQPMERAADLEVVKASYARMANRESVIKRAIEKDVTEDGEIKDRIRKTSYYTKSPADVIQRLQQEISISSIRDTRLMQISLKGSKKEELPEIVNSMADAFIVDVAEKATEERRRQIEDLRSEVGSLTRDRNQILTRINENLRGADVPILQERSTIQQFELQNLSRLLLDKQMEVNEVEQSLAVLVQQKNQGTLGNSPMVQQTLDMDPTLRSLQAARDNLEIELLTISREFGANHRKVKVTQARLDEVKTKYDSRQQKLLEETAGGVLQAMANEVERKKAEVVQIRQNYNESANKARVLAQRINQIQEDRAQLDSIDKRLADMNSALMKFNLARRSERPLQIAAYAELPKEPSMPRYPMMVALGVFLGLGIGVGLAFLLELADASIKGPADITRRVDIPMLGMVPHEDDLEEEIEDIHKALLEMPDSLLGEAFRQIRTTLLFSGPASQRRSLLVTSPSPDDGRTTVALNLAASIAHGGRKVLLLDANFRQPMIRNLFPTAPDAGLSSALVGQCSWRDQVHQVEHNLSVITAGPLPPNPSELLESQQMQTILGEMTAEFDQVIIDAAPVLVVSDPAVLSRHVDGVILVVRAGVNTYGMVQRARSILVGVGANLVGAVLNGVRVTAGGYLKKNYDQFYEYREQPQLPPTGSEG